MYGTVNVHPRYLTITKTIRMEALIGIGALIYKNTFYGGAYWKEGAKSNHYGKAVSKYSASPDLPVADSSSGFPISKTNLSTGINF